MPNNLPSNLPDPEPPEQYDVPDPTSWHPRWCAGDDTRFGYHRSAPIPVATTDASDSKITLTLWQELFAPPADGELSVTITFDTFGLLADVREYNLTAAQVLSLRDVLAPVAAIVEHAGVRGGER